MADFDLEGLREGNRRSLAKAITVIESSLLDDRLQAQEILERCLPFTGNSVRLGITGIPGVGKSTFIERFGLHLLEQGKRVAVLAVDPSSPIAGGSILGDKTRMEELSRRSDAFIRPSPASGTMGGVAQKTRETMLLCEAAGYDVILVETVGVGQSEYQVAGMVDFFMVLMLPNAGDELQGIKKGIMELADALVINKADGESLNLAERTRTHYKAAMGLLRHAAHWEPRVMTCSSVGGTNIDAVWAMILEHHADSEAAGAFSLRRDRQLHDWMYQLIDDMLKARLRDNPDAQGLLPELERQVLAREITPYTAASRVLDCL
ncbi:MAG: methylmalonyl Co-A mutase-associated GTPase MeaB [Pseudomonadota bacterium]